jgi:hypothetical protein
LGALAYREASRRSTASGRTPRTARYTPRKHSESIRGERSRQSLWFRTQEQTTSRSPTRLSSSFEGSWHGNPSGRLSHTAALKDNGYFVVDVWEFPEAFQRFAQRLISLIEAVG